MSRTAGYLSATAHPQTALLVILPLLAGYELAVTHGPNPAPRAGADEWVRTGLTHLGLAAPCVAPALVTAMLLIWAWLARRDRPKEFVRPLFGVAFESVVFAVMLWTLAKNFGPLLERLQAALPSRPAADLIGYIGAGIYEEAVFRLALFGGLVLTLRTARVPTLLAVPVALTLGAVLFAYAHHAGPVGEPLHTGKFLFRTVAGIYFTLLFITRGFAITTGTHITYDVLVGVPVG